MPQWQCMRQEHSGGGDDTTIHQGNHLSIKPYLFWPLQDRETELNETISISLAKHFTLIWSIWDQSMMGEYDCNDCNDALINSLSWNPDWQWCLLDSGVWGNTESGALIMVFGRVIDRTSQILSPNSEMAKLSKGHAQSFQKGPKICWCSKWFSVTEWCNKV